MNKIPVDFNHYFLGYFAVDNGNIFIDNTTRKDLYIYISAHNKSEYTK